jgi:hypothetical protein
MVDVWGVPVRLMAMGRMSISVPPLVASEWGVG